MPFQPAQYLPSSSEFPSLVQTTWLLERKGRKQSSFQDLEVLIPSSGGSSFIFSASSQKRLLFKAISKSSQVGKGSLWQRAKRQSFLSQGGGKLKWVIEWGSFPSSPSLLPTSSTLQQQGECCPRAGRGGQIRVDKCS